MNNLFKETANWLRKTLNNIATARVVPLSLILLIVITPLVSLAFPQSVSAEEWFNELWSYRTPVTVSGSSATQTDYQVLIEDWNTSTLVSAGKLQPDCRDLRITDKAGNLLQYWIEEEDRDCEASTATDIWVRMKKISTGDNTIYLYYGNRRAVPYQSPSRTFEFFEGFNGWYDSGWGYRKKLTVPANSVKGGRLDDFTVYVDLADLGSDFHANADSAGDDIVVTASDGVTKLSREVVEIDTGAETGELWFKPPSLYNGGDNVFYIYYGNGSATETNDSDVFTTGYRTVHHLNSDPTDSAPQYGDSSTYNNYGTAVGSMTAGDLVTGKIGNAIDFDGVNDYIRINNTNNNLQLNRFTISAWVNTTDTANDTILHKSQNDNGSENNDNYDLHVSTVGYIHTEWSSNGADHSSSGTTDITDGEWHYIVGTYNGRSLNIFVDGVLENSNSTTTGTQNPYTGSGDATIATNALTNHGGIGYYTGMVDELRVYSEAQSPQWIQTEYANQNNPTDFYLVGLQESEGTLSDQLSRWTYTETPTISSGALELSNASAVEGVSSNNQFGSDQKLIFRAAQSATTTASARAGFSNTVIGVDTMYNDDGAYAQFDAAVENFKFPNINEGSFTTQTSATAEDTAYHEFEIEHQGSSIDYVLNHSSTTTNSSNVPDEDMYIRFEADNSSDTLSIDWVAVANYATTGPSSVVIGSEENGEESGPILHYAFETAKDGRVVDSSGGGNDGVVANNARISRDCIKNNCMEFDGSGDFVYIPYSTNLNTPDALSISAWIKSDEYDANMFIYEKTVGNSVNTGQACFVDTNNRFVFRTYNSSNQINDLTYTYTTGKPENHNWHHVVCWYDGSEKRIYLDGEIVSSAAYTQTLRTGNGNSVVGAYGSGNNYWWDGLIDELKVYPRAMTQDEINAEVQLKSSVLGASTGQSLEQIEGWWLMDEDSWSGTAGEIRDYSGNSNDGTAAGGATTVAGYVGRAGDFSGSNYATAGNQINIANDSFTVAAWLERDTTGANHVALGLGPASTNNSLHFGWRSTDTFMCAFYGNDLDTAVDTTTTWNHWACKYDAVTNERTIYKNGVEVASDIASADFAGTGTLQIGRTGFGSSNFDGSIDDLRVYEKALTQVELQEIMEYKPPAVAHWKFDEKSGTTAYDSTIGANHGTLTNMNESDWVLGKVAGALDFDGTGDHVLVSSDAILPKGTMDRTYSFWVNPRTQTTGDRIFSMGNWAVGNSFDIIWNAGNTLSVIGHTNNYLSSGSVPTDEWTHCTVVLDDGTLRIYFNGVLDSSQATSLNTVTAGEFRIGGSLPSRSATDFDGLLDDFRVYNYALSTDQVADLYSHNFVENDLSLGDTNQDDLIGYWKLDEDGWNGTSGEVLDETGEHNGTRVGNATTTADAKFNRAGTFDGSGDYVNVPYSSEFITQTFTISAWIKPDAVNQNNTIVTTEPNSSPAQNGYGLRIRTDNTVWLIIGRAGNAAIISSESTVSVGEWTQITATYDGSIAKMYINGELEASEYIGRTINSTQALRIGWFSSSHTAEAFDGRIDDVRLYNKTFSEVEVNGLYNRFKTVFGGQEFSQGDEPILQLNLDEKSGTTAADSSSYKNDGTLNNMDPASDWIRTTYLGASQRALDFDGSNDNISLSASDLPSGNSPRTISAWLNPAVSNSRVALFYGSNSSSNGYYIIMIGSNFCIGNWGGGDVCGSTTISTDTWYHVAMSHDGTTTALYLNGQLEASTSKTYSTTASTTFYVSGYSGATTDNWTGMIDSVKAWDRALPLRDIAFEYNGGAPVGWWKLDQGEGNTVYDFSGNENPGTMVNMIPASDWLGSDLCIINGCLDFDGSNDYVSVPNPGVSNASVSFWVYPTTLASDDRIFSAVNGGTSIANSFRYQGTSLEVWNGGAWLAFPGSSGALTTGSWQHIVLNDEGSTLVLYIDGLRVGSVSASIDMNGETLGIGARYQLAHGQHFDGRIDEFKIYNYQLSQDDIIREYNSNGAALRYE